MSVRIAYLLAIVLGVFSGAFDFVWLQEFGLFVSDVFIRIFKCVSLPIIALSLVVTLSSYGASQGMNGIFKRALTYTLGTTVVAATISCLLYLIVAPTNLNTLTEVNELVGDKSTSYWQHLANLVPTNIFAPFLEHQVMGVLLVGVVVGLAIRHIPDLEARATIVNFFKGAQGVFWVITSWVVKIIPLGLFGFITATVIELRKGMDMGGIAQYLAVVVLANLVQGFVVLPLWLKANGISPFMAMRAMSKALSVAFFSKSSAGTLPVTMEMAEKNLGVNPQVSRFVLPLCTSINMNGCAAFIFVTVIYLMQNHGVEISMGTMVMWIGIATIAAIGNAGVPMGCFFLSASLLASMNVPITLLGVILPFYSLIDMVETALNVWSDSCVAKVVDVRSPEVAYELESPADVQNKIAVRHIEGV